jgi:sec-independent protein translocase protein TatC
MSLVEHLAELRTRLVRAILALIAGTIVGYVVFPYVLQLLISPYCASLEVLRPGADCTLIALRRSSRSRCG